MLQNFRILIRSKQALQHLVLIVLNETFNTGIDWQILHVDTGGIILQIERVSIDFADLLIREMERFEKK